MGRHRKTKARRSKLMEAHNGFRELADEGARSCIYGGIHYTFEVSVSRP